MIAIGRKVENKFNFNTVTISGAEAVKILAETNVSNRKLSDSKVREYAKAMKAKKWQANGESLSFSNEGKLLDGQHRLQALATLGPEFELDFIVIEGMGGDSFHTIDTGKSRSAGDLLSIAGIDVKKVATLSAAARMMHRYEVGISNFEARQKWNKDKSKNKPKFYKKDAILQNRDVYDFIEDPSHKSLFFSGVDFVNNNRETLPLSISESLFFYVLLNMVGGSEGANFCEKLFTGLNIDIDTPVHTLRTKLTNVMTAKHKSQEFSRGEKMAATLVAWNHHATGKDMSKTVLGKVSLGKLVNKIKAESYSAQLSVKVNPKVEV